MYDLIGDIHGQADELVSLLHKLDYRISDGVYQHRERVAIFLGDLIDSGPGQRRVIGIVRAMVEQGKALAIMGNHEFNALGFHQEDRHRPGTWLRPRSNKNTRQHLAFLQAYLHDEDALRDVLDWFRSLPLWLDLPDGPRAVHACWHPESMRLLQPLLGPGNTLTDDLLHSASRRNSKEYNAVEILLSGLELDLPTGTTFNDRYGVTRREVRIKWWLENPSSFAELAMPERLAQASPELRKLPVHAANYRGYDTRQPPVFFGHYWFEGDPRPIHPNAACLDYSAARAGGKLVAYRWSGERVLEVENYVSVQSSPIMGPQSGS
jgi:hypothetical protein